MMRTKSIKQPMKKLNFNKILKISIIIVVLYSLFLLTIIAINSKSGKYRNIGGRLILNTQNGKIYEQEDGKLTPWPTTSTNNDKQPKSNFLSKLKDVLNKHFKPKTKPVQPVKNDPLGLSAISTKNKAADNDIDYDALLGALNKSAIVAPQDYYPSLNDPLGILTSHQKVFWEEYLKQSKINIPFFKK